jgi:hypothetical protein
MTSRKHKANISSDAAWIAFSRCENIHELTSNFQGFTENLGFNNPLDIQTLIQSTLEKPFSLSLSEIKSRWKSLSDTANELISAYLIRGMDYRNVTAQQTQEAYAVLRSSLNPESPLHGYAAYHQSMRWIWEGQPANAIQALDRFETNSVSQTNEVLVIWINTLIQSARAFALMNTGNFREATTMLQASHATSKKLDFSIRSGIESLLATLYRESNQSQKALSIWYEPERMQELECGQNWGQVTVTHLNACRCAIDLKDISAAHLSLELAEKYLPLTESYSPRLLGYNHLRRGELATLEEDYATGEEKLIAAIEYFEQLDPPCPEGWLESRLALGQYALLQENLPLAWAIIRKLIEETQELGHLSLRSQALLLQTWFFVSKQPPGADAYEQVLDQIHMIHNPALLFHAFSNLLSYAVEHLDESEADQLRKHMSALRTRLTDENYQELLEKHVPEHLRIKELE